MTTKPEQQRNHMPFARAAMIWVVGIVLLAALVLALWLHGRVRLILVPNNTEAPRSSLTIDVPIEQAHSIIQKTIESLKWESTFGKRYRSISGYGPYMTETLALNDPQAQKTPATVGELSLRDWLAMPDKERNYDLLIEPDVDYYWFSDYFNGGKPVEYTASFILHLTPLSSVKTKVFIMQTHVFIRLGESFGLSREGALGMSEDIQFVDPSPQAATDLVDFLASAFANQQQ